MLIDRTDCTAKQPGLGIEGYPTSPLLHIRLQSILVTRIFKRFGPPKNIQTMDDIQDYVQILESWMATFPPEFYFNDPDVSNETEYPWIALHKHYLHTTALSMALGPLRAFMAKRMPIHSTPAIELQFRADGVNRALDLMKAVHAFLDYVWERDTTFHFVPFCIFDTAALLCSSLLHTTMGPSPVSGTFSIASSRAWRRSRGLARQPTLPRRRTTFSVGCQPRSILPWRPSIKL